MCGGIGNRDREYQRENEVEKAEMTLQHAHLLVRIVSPEDTDTGQMGSLAADLRAAVRAELGTRLKFLATLRAEPLGGFDIGRLTAPDRERAEHDALVGHAIDVVERVGIIRFWRMGSCESAPIR